jgi:hypothetical protein
MISFAERFVLIAVPKCGTTSLEAALAPHLPTRLAGPPAVKHATLRDFNRYLRPFLAEKGFEGFETVGTVREPIDWLMSWWRYRSRDAIRGRPKYAGHVTFDEFARAYLSPDPPPYARMHERHPSELLVDGDRAADLLFRYENLDALVQWLSERLGVELDLPRRNVSAAPRAQVDPALEGDLRDALAADYALWDRAA